MRHGWQEIVAGIGNPNWTCTAPRFVLVPAHPYLEHCAAASQSFLVVKYSIYRWSGLRICRWRQIRPQSASICTSEVSAPFAPTPPPLTKEPFNLQDVVCQPIGSGLKKSKEYRLMFGVKQLANCVGLKKGKSDYVRYDGHEISWREPFGPGL